MLMSVGGIQPTDKRTIEIIKKKNVLFMTNLYSRQIRIIIF